MEQVTSGTSNKWKDHGKPQSLASISVDYWARLRGGKDLAKYNSVEGLCIQKFYKEVGLLRMGMYGGHCTLHR